MRGRDQLASRVVARDGLMIETSSGKQQSGLCRHARVLLQLPFAALILCADRRWYRYGISLRRSLRNASHSSKYSLGSAQGSMAQGASGFWALASYRALGTQDASKSVRAGRRFFAPCIATQARREAPTSLAVPSGVPSGPYPVRSPQTSNAWALGFAWGLPCRRPRQP